MSDTEHDDAVPTDTLGEGEASGDARSGAVSDEVDARMDADVAGADDGGSQDPGGSGTGPRGDDETVSADDLTELQDDPTAVEPTD
jgi:hypothetical protein